MTDPYSGTPPKVLIFDVNETLLDLSHLKPAFAAVFGSAEPIGEWFARMLHGSLVSNHVNDYRAFGDIGLEALLVLAEKRGVDLDVDAATTIVAGMRSLPPHPDVLPAMERLKTAGFGLVTLTNGSYDVAIAQISNSGIAGYLDAALSVDEARRFKPAPEVYLTAAMRIGVEVDEAMMVASHDWDILGARSIGMDGAFIARPGAIWGSIEPPPTITVPDLGGVADALGA